MYFLDRINSINDLIKTIFNSQNIPCPNPTIKERLNQLALIENWINEHESEIVDTHIQDLGKPKSEVDLTEIWYVMSEIKLVKKNLRYWMSLKRKGVSSFSLFPAKAWIHTEPKGVVLIISPWNFPFNLTVGPLVSALAAGNRVIIKPSEMTPNVSALIEKMVTDLFDSNTVSVFQGDVSVSSELLKLPFHHIFFTGSPEVGKIVMSAAATHLASVTLELGGKSPTIIDETADIGMAVKKIAWGKCMNAGQSCIAPDYILVHENVKDEFVSKLSNRLDMVFGKTLEEKKSSKDYGRIVNSPHWTRINQLLESAINEGARVAHGGGKDEIDKFIEPTLIDDVTPNMKIMSEEIFGPLLPIIIFKNLNECLEIILDRPKPLALYMFSNSRKNIEYIIQNTSSGGMVINEVNSHFINLELPFGGVNTSGFGRCHGFEGFRSFSNERSILKNGRFSQIGLVFPPYTKWTKRIIHFVTKYL